jgi:hypothetical protein
MMDSSPALLTNTEPPAPYEQALLPWETSETWRELLGDYRAAYAPHGPAEATLINQLAWIDWRRRRLVLGERAMHMASLDRRTGSERFDSLSRRALAVTGGVRPQLSSAGAIKSGDAEDATSEAEWAAMVAAAEYAEARLETADKGAYAEALASLPEETAEWFLETCETEEKYEPKAESLQRFLIAEVLPFFRKHLAGARGGPAVRLQAWGESLAPDRMDRLTQLDERLTRQYEKVLGMLLKLQAIRLGAPSK